MRIWDRQREQHNWRTGPPRRAPYDRECARDRVREPVPCREVCRAHSPSRDTGARRRLTGSMARYGALAGRVGASLVVAAIGVARGVLCRAVSDRWVARPRSRIEEEEETVRADSSCRIRWGRRDVRRARCAVATRVARMARCDLRRDRAFDASESVRACVLEWRDQSRRCCCRTSRTDVAPFG